MTSAWTAAHVAGIDPNFPPRAPLITAGDVTPILPGVDFWDMWPLALADGSNAEIAGGILWFALSAPVLPNPIDRHALARIRLLHQIGDTWRDGGNALPDGFSPGSREWSGSAILDPGSGRVTLFFTAAGRRGETMVSSEQRLFQSRGQLDLSGAIPRILDWTAPVQSFASDGVIYDRADAVAGLPGTMKAFRDPAYFRDPADGQSYLVFAGSLKTSTHASNGAIGLARAVDPGLESWALLPPILHADGLNNELERPHLIHRGGLYYLFWSTQAHTFAAGGPAGPTGLYGMVAPALLGPYRPLNGSGLVIGNPEAEPLQAFSWWVMGDDSVTSFVDYWGLGGRRPEAYPDLVRSRFGGIPAPFLQLDFAGDRVGLRSPTG